MSKLHPGFLASCLAPAVVLAACGTPATRSTARAVPEVNDNHSLIAVGPAPAAAAPAPVGHGKGSPGDLRIALDTEKVIGQVFAPKARSKQAPVAMIAVEGKAATPPANGTGSQESTGLDHRAAYEQAWRRFRAQDHERALEAMVSAIASWQPKPVPTAAHQELVFMMARAGVPVERATRVFRELAPGDTATRFRWLYQLYQGYEASGYRALATEALDAVRALQGDATPAPTRIGIQLRYVNSYIAINRPDLAAQWLIDGHRALPACGAPCQHLDEAIVAQLKQFAPHYHGLYKTTQDERLYQAARRVYEYHVSLQRDDATAVQAHLQALQSVRKSMVPGRGTHDRSLIDWATRLRNNTMRACYESVLLRDPKVSGAVALTLGIDDSGALIDVQTDPPVGPAGLPAVAGCVQERTRTWQFPSRSRPGTTTVTRTYEFTPQSGP